MGESLSSQQSQLGETSITSDTWKQGLPSQTALEYSAMRSPRIWVAASSLGTIASWLQTPMQWPHPTHLVWSIEARRGCSARCEIAPCAQALAQAMQPMQRSWST